MRLTVEGMKAELVKEHHLDALVRAAFAEGRRPRIDHREGEGVHPLGPVEHDARDAVAREPSVEREAARLSTQGVHDEAWVEARLRGPDRREAIACALGQANAGDIVAVLGKGHESGQEINGQVFPFDDREVIRQVSAHA